ncbi:MAG: hypothetical protein AAF713_15835 [Pseudomonadota bacterium]
MTDPRPPETPLRPEEDCVRITLRIDRAVFARLPQGRTNTETARFDAIARSVHTLALEVARVRADTAGLVHALGERVDLASDEARRIMADAQAQSEASATRALETSLAAGSALPELPNMANGERADTPFGTAPNGKDRMRARAEPTG